MTFILLYNLACYNEKSIFYINIMTNINKTSLLFLVISFNVIAQDLDQNFLDSLPPELSAELLMQSQNQAVETKVFNPPSTDVRLISENLEKIKSDLILIESSLNKDSNNNSAGNDLRVIGENFLILFSQLLCPSMNHIWI